MAYGSECFVWLLVFVTSYGLKDHSNKIKTAQSVNVVAAAPVSRAAAMPALLQVVSVHAAHCGIEKSLGYWRLCSLCWQATVGWVEGATRCCTQQCSNHDGASRHQSFYMQGLELSHALLPCAGDRHIHRESAGAIYMTGAMQDRPCKASERCLEKLHNF